MKKFALISLLFSGTLQAQTPPPVAQEEIMQQMAAMQECMAQINMQELQQMEIRSQQLSTQIEKLCAGNNEAEAKAVALKFSNEVMNSNSMKTMQRCSQMVQGMEKQLEVPDFEKQLKTQSICDIINQ